MKKDKEQSGYVWGPRGSAERDQKSQDYHEDKRRSGARGDENGNLGDMKNGEYQKKSIVDKISTVTGLTGTALVIYLIISEGTRVIPFRNFVPVP